MALPVGPFCLSPRSNSFPGGHNSAAPAIRLLRHEASPAPFLTPQADASLDRPFFYMPPGLGLQLRGASYRDDFDSSSDARKSSSSPTSSTSASAYTSFSASPSSSASSIEDSIILARRKLWSEAPGEEAGLAAARRALWEDPPEGARVGSPSLSVFSTPTDSEVENDGVAGDGAEDEEDDLDDLDDEPFDLPRLPSPSQPAHATLSPRSSCLRPPLSPRSFLLLSVQFSDDSPETGTTYSPLDYERRGDAPIEKLSMRELVELKSVREAVGLYSGKLEKEGTGGIDEDGEREGSTGTREDEDGERSGMGLKGCGSLAAVVGVVTYTHNSAAAPIP